MVGILTSVVTIKIYPIICFGPGKIIKFVEQLSFDILLLLFGVSRLSLERREKVSGLYRSDKFNDWIHLYCEPANSFFRHCPTILIRSEIFNCCLRRNEIEERFIINGMSCRKNNKNTYLLYISIRGMCILPVFDIVDLGKMKGRVGFWDSRGILDSAARSPSTLITFSSDRNVFQWIIHLIVGTPPHHSIIFQCSSRSPKLALTPESWRRDG